MMSTGANEQVVLVDEHDRAIGTMGKLEAHRSAVLHRAFSVFVFDGHGRLLLQRRAETKYHSGGLWSNTCCGHPRPGEHVADAASRRLGEEMGFTCALSPQFDFTYRADVGNGLTEHEFDHVFFGFSDNVPSPDPSEAGEWRYVEPAVLLNEIRSAPEQFTVWLRACFPQVMLHLANAA